MNRSPGLRLVVLLCLALPAAGPARAVMDITDIVVFGDSLSDTGNLFAADGGVLPAPPYFGGRASDGLLWNELLAADLGADLNNLAIIGASTGGRNVWDDDPGIGALGPFGGLYQQVGSYIGSGVNPDALHVMWIGSNNFLTIPTEPIAALIRAAVELSVSLGILNAAGVEEVLLFNLPDFGLTPRLSGTPLAGGGTFISEVFNSFLDRLEGGLVNAPGALQFPEIQVFDVYALLNEVVADPAAFGLANVTDACFDPVTATVCADPNEYLFWDDLHPSAATHAVLASRLVEVLNVPASVSAPAPLAPMLAGVLVLLLGVRMGPWRQALRSRARQQGPASAV